jgi:hypothetical protein
MVDDRDAQFHLVRDQRRDPTRLDFNRHHVESVRNGGPVSPFVRVISFNPAIHRVTVVRQKQQCVSCGPEYNRKAMILNTMS